MKSAAHKISFWDRISVEQVKIELMRTAFRSSQTFLGRFDPRVLIAWYGFFAIVPWFIHNKTILLGMLLLVAVLTYLSKASILVMIVLALGLLTDTVYILIVALLFGGGLTAAWALSVLVIKLMIIALASIAVFCSMDPEKISDALYSLGMPATFSFGVAYGYRMLPILIEEYSNLVYSYRLRGKAPDKPGFLWHRIVIYRMTIAVKAFYPLMLNTAKRTRTTVEALEVKGFKYAAENPQVKKIKLSYLKVKARDLLFLACSIVYIAALFYVGSKYPL